MRANRVHREGPRRAPPAKNQKTKRENVCGQTKQGSPHNKKTRPGAHTTRCMLHNNPQRASCMALLGGGGGTEGGAKATSRGVGTGREPNSSLPFPVCPQKMWQPRFHGLPKALRSRTQAHTGVTLVHALTGEQENLASRRHLDVGARAKGTQGGRGAHTRQVSAPSKTNRPHATTPNSPTATTSPRAQDPLLHHNQGGRGVSKSTRSA